MIKEFWKNWKNKTNLERNAIESVKKAKNFILKNIPKNKIISIYIKGSFVTRELNKKSDIDIVPVFNNNFTLKKFKKIRDENKPFLKPSELLPLSLTELKNQKSKLHSRRDTFLRDLKHHKLIYGKRLIRENYPSLSENKLFSNEIKYVKDFIKNHPKGGRYGFSQLIKQIFWLSYSQQVMQGKSPPRTWFGLNDFIKDKDHIIHEAYYFRIHPTKKKILRQKFIKNAINYLSHLDNSNL